MDVRAQNQLNHHPHKFQIEATTLRKTHNCYFIYKYFLQNLSYELITNLFKSEKPRENPLSKIYKRSNFKLILDFIIKSWGDFFARKRKFSQKIKKLIEISTEARKRYSRSYCRQLRYQIKTTLLLILSSTRRL